MISGHETKKSLELYQHLSLESVKNAYQNAVQSVGVSAGYLISVKVLVLCWKLTNIVRFPKYRGSGMALPIDPDAGGSALERMAPPELFRHLFHRAPVHARMSVYVFDEPL